MEKQNFLISHQHSNITGNGIRHPMEYNENKKLEFFLKKISTPSSLLEGHSQSYQA